MSDYFDVSLDYLMRGVENFEDTEKATAAYKANDMLAIWNNFVSNLSGRQRKLLMILYALAVCVFLAAVVTFIYGAGYVIGQLVGHLAQ